MTTHVNPLEKIIGVVSLLIFQINEITALALWLNSLILLDIGNLIFLLNIII